MKDGKKVMINCAKGDGRRGQSSPDRGNLEVIFSASHQQMHRCKVAVANNCHRAPDYDTNNDD